MTPRPPSKKLALFLLPLVLLGVDCGGGTKVLAPAAPPPVSAAFLRAAPDTLSLVGYGSVVAADLSREVGANNNSLTATITFSLISASDFSRTVTAADVYVVNGNEVWRTVLAMQDPNSLPHDEVVLIGRDGPDWAPGVQADVVLGLTIEGRGFQLVNLGNATITQPASTQEGMAFRDLRVDRNERELGNWYGLAPGADRIALQRPGSGSRSR